MHVSAVGYQTNLYTRTAAGVESDEIDRWLNHDFEDPVTDSLLRVVNEDKLSPEDYRLLVRFAAAQFVRTPAFFLRYLPKWQALTSKLMENSMQEAKELLESAKARGADPSFEPFPNAEFLPLSVTHERSPDGKTGTIKVQSVVGRGHWIYTMKHFLGSTLNRMHEHKWTIISAHDQMPWFTSDDPLILLNFHNPSRFDFGGGIASPNTEIMMPLSPQHLLYTQVGRRPPQRGTGRPIEQCALIRKMIANHAYRYIFSKVVDREVELLRPRHVSLEAFRHEQEQWRSYHKEQTTAEDDIRAGGWSAAG